MTSCIGMGNACSKGGSKKKKSARVANATHGSEKAESLIHSERSNQNKVEKISKWLILSHFSSNFIYIY